MNQVKSKQRVKDHGEVFTPDFIVNDMLDLVKNETDRIESRFLEPACGDGNFLAPILKKKLDYIAKRYTRSQIEFERNAVVALASIYGIELLQDNVKQCRERLFNIFADLYKKKFKKKIKEDLLKSIQFIISRNIIWGNALNLKTVGDEVNPIVFSEWTMLGSALIRKDYFFEELVPNDGSSGLFPVNYVTDDEGKKHFDPKEIPIQYPRKHYLNLDYDDTK